MQDLIEKKMTSKPLGTLSHLNNPKMGGTNRIVEQEEFHITLIPLP